MTPLMSFFLVADELGVELFTARVRLPLSAVVLVNLCLTEQESPRRARSAS
jgi:hypothetical protein